MKTAWSISGLEDVGAFLVEPDWLQRAVTRQSRSSELGGAAFAPLVPRPGKIVCVGLNYRNHILEMGRDLPEYPTLFTKYADALVGANDDIVKPPETDAFDWECELAVVIGSTVRRARGADAERAIAGFSVLNDVTCRDWQFRTKEWLQGKSWEATTPLGPYLVTPDELVGGVRPALEISTTIDGETMQQDSTADLLFDPWPWSSTSRRWSPCAPVTSSRPAPRAVSATPVSRRATSRSANDSSPRSSASAAATTPSSPTLERDAGAPLQTTALDGRGKRPASWPASRASTTSSVGSDCATRLDRSAPGRARGRER